jgi:hypothetical protein
MRPLARAVLVALVAILFTPHLAAADTHELSFGASAGGYRWSGDTCPYVTPCDFPMQVRAQSLGARYEARLGTERLREGHALIVDVRAELTRSRIESVEGDATEARALEAAERDRTRWLGALQIAVGYDGPLLGVRAGLGVVGTTRVNGDRIESRYLQGDEVRIPVPNADLRVGPVARGPAMHLGVGLVPLIGSGRWYALYALARERLPNGVELDAGVAWVAIEQTDRHAAALLAGSGPIGPLRVGLFAMIDPWTRRALVDGATYGASVSLCFDASRAPAAPAPTGPPIGVTPRR